MRGVDELGRGAVALAGVVAGPVEGGGVMRWTLGELRGRLRRWMGGLVLVLARLSLAEVL